MKKKLTVLMALALSIAATTGRAQQVEKGFELLQLVRIAEMYKAVPNLSFSVNYTYADSTHQDSLLEQLSGSSKMSAGRYWMMLDSVESVQGSQYNLVVYHQDSTIAINARTEYGNQLRLPFLDSMFRNNNLDSLGVSELDDSTRKLSVRFRPGSSYSLYELTYDKKKFYIRTIRYFIRNVPNDGLGVTSGTAVITMALSAYSTAAIDPSIFSEERFVYKLGGQFHPQPGYTAFNLVINTDH